MAVLVVLAGEERGREITLPEEGEIVIGRALGDVNFNDGRLSRKHCKIVKSPEGYVLHDLDSTNGIYVNGERVREAVLDHGDKVRLGYTVLEFQDTDDFSALKLLDEESKEADEEPSKRRRGHTRIVAAKNAAMGKDAPTSSRRLISAKGRFCEACGAVIDPEDLDADRARRMDGLYLCQRCVGVVESKGIAPKDVVSYLKWKERDAGPLDLEHDTHTGLEPIK